jgi:hypothetical protein
MIPLIFIKEIMSLNATNQDIVERSRNDREAKFKNQELGNYNVSAYEFPDGLQGNDDLQHYVAFFINVRENSEIGKQNVNRLFNLPDSSRRRENRLTETEAGAATQAILNNAGTIGALVGFLSNIKKGAISATGAAFLGAGAGVAGREIVNALDPTFLTAVNRSFRLKDVITLHLQERPSVRYGVNYTEKDMGALTGFLAQGSATKTFDDLSKVGKEALARGVASLIKLPSLIPGGGTLADLRSLTTRTTTNPFREVLFESVDYRTFNFRYAFFPKSSTESNRISDIIQLFKTHMHPEISDNRFFYMHPSEFEIKYYYKDKGNPYLHSFATCALTGLEVEYGGEQFSTFENGAPTEIGLSLTFREIEQVTSQGVVKYGY